MPAGFVDNSSDCDDTNFNINPDATEVCDGNDNDCDGVSDGSEGLTQQCGQTDLGQCTYGTEQCNDAGNWVNCDAVFPATEVCDGNDNDCDDQTDEGCDQVVEFPDLNLETAIRETIVKPTGDITVGDLQGITNFLADSRSISNISGLEYCINLTDLDLSDNQISDISPLADLVNLTYLDLQWNAISDLSIIGTLSELTFLNVADNLVADLSPIARLTKLKDLGIQQNIISDLSPLNNLLQLKTLNAGMNNIHDLSPLSGLISMQKLWLYGNNITDITSLAFLNKLTLLSLQDNYVADISALADLENLEIVDLRKNYIVTLSALTEMRKFKELYLNNNFLDEQAFNEELPKIIENNPHAFISHDTNPGTIAGAIAGE